MLRARALSRCVLEAVRLVADDDVDVCAREQRLHVAAQALVAADHDAHLRALVVDKRLDDRHRGRAVDLGGRLQLGRPLLELVDPVVDERDRARDEHLLHPRPAGEQRADDLRRLAKAGHVGEHRTMLVLDAVAADRLREEDDALALVRVQPARERTRHVDASRELRRRRARRWLRAAGAADGGDARDGGELQLPAGHDRAAVGSLVVVVERQVEHGLRRRARVATCRRGRDQLGSRLVAVVVVVIEADRATPSAVISAGRRRPARLLGGQAVLVALAVRRCPAHRLGQQAELVELAAAPRRRCWQLREQTALVELGHRRKPRVARAHRLDTAAQRCRVRHRHVAGRSGRRGRSDEGALARLLARLPRGLLLVLFLLLRRQRAHARGAVRRSCANAALGLGRRRSAGRRRRGGRALRRDGADEWALEAGALWRRARRSRRQRARLLRDKGAEEVVDLWHLLALVTAAAVAAPDQLHQVGSATGRAAAAAARDEERAVHGRRRAAHVARLDRRARRVERVCSRRVSRALLRCGLLRHCAG
jgi:hypothetical protein